MYMCLCIFRHFYNSILPNADPIERLQLKLLVKEANCRKISSDIKEKKYPKIIFKIVTNEIITVNYFNKFNRTFWQKHYYIKIFRLLRIYASSKLVSMWELQQTSQNMWKCNPQAGNYLCNITNEEQKSISYTKNFYE